MPAAGLPWPSIHSPSNKEIGSWISTTHRARAPAAALAEDVQRPVCDRGPAGPAGLQQQRRNRSRPRHPCAQVTGSGSVDVGSGLPGDPAAPEPASGFRPQDAGVRQDLHGGDRQPLCVQSRLRSPEEGRLGGGRRGRRAGGAGPGRAAVVGPGRRRVHAALRCQDQESPVLRRPRNGAGRRHRRLPAHHQRHQSGGAPADSRRNRTRVRRCLHAAEAERPLGRHARRRAHARAGPQGLRQPGLERPLRLRRPARHRRLPDQRPAWPPPSPDRGPCC